MSLLPTGVPVIGNRGFHPILEVEQPHLFVDTCAQIWSDADLTNAHRHGVTAIAVTAWNPHVVLEQALQDIMYWHLMAREHPNLIVVNTADDIRRAKRDDQLAMILASQDGDFIGSKLHRIEAFYRLGLRILIPAYNSTSLICAGCLDRTDVGLSRFGEVVVDECNRLGLLLDCSHLGKRASLEIIERSGHPVVFSHSNAKAVVENPRSVDEEQIKACATRGGVIGVVAVGSLTLKKGKRERPNLSDLADNIDYFAQLVGSTDNIGIGTDFCLGTYPVHRPDPWGEPAWEVTLAAVRGAFNSLPNMIVRPSSPIRYVEGFNCYAEVLDLISELTRRRYSDHDIGKILGKNFLRVFAQVWK